MKPEVDFQSYRWHYTGFLAQESAVLPLYSARSLSYINCNAHYYQIWETDPYYIVKVNLIFLLRIHTDNCCFLTFRPYTVCLCRELKLLVLWCWVCN